MDNPAVTSSPVKSPPTIHHLVAHPDVHSSSDEYAQRFAGPTGEWLLAVQSALLLATLDCEPRAQTILDVGGGHGQIASALTESATLRARYHVTVLGSSSLVSKRLEPLVREGKVTFREGALLNLPFPDQSFDCVTSFRILSHISDWQRFLHELCRVARYAVIVDFPPKSALQQILGTLFSLKRAIEKNTRPFLVFRPSDLNREFDRCDFRLVQQASEFALPMVLHRMMGKLPTGICVSRSIENIARVTGVTGLIGAPRIALARRVSSNS